jgi:hypothetical protein
MIKGDVSAIFSLRSSIRPSHEAGEYSPRCCPWLAGGGQRSSKRPDRVATRVATVVMAATAGH